MNPLMARWHFYGQTQRGGHYSPPHVRMAFDPAPFAAGDTVRALAAGILAEYAFDRLPILADAPDEADAPPWIGRALRDTPNLSAGWHHLVYETDYEYTPSDDVSPFFRSLAGLPPSPPEDALGEERTERQAGEGGAARAGAAGAGGDPREAG